MEADSEDVPIRIVKKKSGHAGHHGGAWKVAYADFVTAMMALFIVLWIVGQSKAVKESVAGYFKDPGAFTSSRGSSGALDGGTGAMEEGGMTDLVKQQEKLKHLGEEILKEIERTPALKALASQVRFDIVDEGLRIEMIEESNSYFFDVGTSSIKPEAAEVLGIIAAQVDSLPNKLVVEGHTDSRPYARADGYSNFELSAERANSARRVLVKNGVTPSQVDEVRGYADTRLRNTKDPFDVTNRRISVLVKFRSPG
ncbi:MAG TPA: flagellar motor protein MotB [Bacteroidota bacterium]|nr:flagellar motor protein MotB [Bacteroidota bacterium]